MSKDNSRRSGQSSSRKEKKSKFWSDFVCDYLSKDLQTSRDLVKVKIKDGAQFIVCFNDVDKISLLYCQFKNLDDDEKKRKDNLKQIFKLLVKSELLEEIGHGTEYRKEYLKYKVLDRDLSHELSTKHSVQNKHNMRRENGETSSDTGIDTNRCDEQLSTEAHEDFRGNEQPSNTGDCFQPDVSTNNETIFSDFSQLAVNHEGIDEFDLSDINESSPDTSQLDVYSLKDPFQLKVSSNNETPNIEQPATDIYNPEDDRITKIIPDKCPWKGGCLFVIRTNHLQHRGTYSVTFGNYGRRYASGTGTDCNLYGWELERIPPAEREEEHWVRVQIVSDNGESIGECSLMYEGKWKDLEEAFFEQTRNSLDGFNANNSPSTSTNTSSSTSTNNSPDGAACGPGSNKRTRNSPITMPMLVYLCDEMAKRGDEPFFWALNKLGVMGKVLEKRCEDLAKTAREHGHDEFAKTIETSPRKGFNDHSMETLTFGNLLDAVRKERLLPNFVLDSDSDSDSNSCSCGGYSGDCDSEDDPSSINKENKKYADGANGDCNLERDGDSNCAMLAGEYSTEETTLSSQIRDVNKVETSVDDFINAAESVADKNSVENTQENLNSSEHIASSSHPPDSRDNNYGATANVSDTAELQDTQNETTDNVDCLNTNNESCIENKIETKKQMLFEHSYADGDKNEHVIDSYKNTVPIVDETERKVSKSKAYQHLGKRCKDLAVIVRKDDPCEFAVTNITSRREPFNDHSMETLASGNLLDGVCKERLLPNSAIYKKCLKKDSHSDQTTYVISLRKFKRSKMYTMEIFKKITAAICAMLNSNGGKVTIHFDISVVPIEDLSQLNIHPYILDDKESLIFSLIRMLEQYTISILGLRQNVSKINFNYNKDSIIISVWKADSLITANYYLNVPSQTQVVEVSPLEPLESIKNDIIYREAIPNPVELGSHCQVFFKDKNCGFHESKICQFKNLKAISYKRTTLADRITCKGNKLRCYVSAFANHSGGHVYYGITDEGVVEGELVEEEKNREEIIKKVKNVINKMIWPNEIGQPERGEQWEIFFEEVVDANSKPVPSTFVIVIYIAPCLGGVFTAEPECYEMVDRKVQKMSFATWKETISQPVLLQKLRGDKNIPHSVQGITWSSDAVRNAFTIDCNELRRIVSNNIWEIFENECDSLQNESDLRETMDLLILFKHITACNRKGEFQNAHKSLEEYKALSSQVQDSFIFGVLGLYLEAALKRASGDLKALKELLTKALEMVEHIVPGLVTATGYIFAASVSDLINLESPAVLTEKALKHLERVPDSSAVLAAMRQEANIILATFHLGCNVTGQLLKDTISNSSLENAKKCIKAIFESACEELPMSAYHEIQLNLVLSIYKYRNSQLSPDQRNRFLRNACRFAKKAKCLAIKCRFTELIEWGENNEALCTQELVNYFDHVRNDESELKSGERKNQHECTGRGDHVEQREGNDRRKSSKESCDSLNPAEQVGQENRKEQKNRLESKKSLKSMESQKRNDGRTASASRLCDITGKAKSQVMSSKSRNQDDLNVERNSQVKPDNKEALLCSVMESTSNTVQESKGQDSSVNHEQPRRDSVLSSGRQNNQEDLGYNLICGNMSMHFILHQFPKSSHGVFCVPEMICSPRQLCCLFFCGFKPGNSFNNTS